MFRSNPHPRVLIGLLSELPSVAGVDEGVVFEATDMGHPTFILTVDPVTHVRAWTPVGGGSSGAGGSNSLIYTDGPITSTNRFNSWQALYAVWQTMTGPKMLYIECTLGVPLHIPLAGMPLGGWVIGQEAKVSGVQVGAYCELVIDDKVTLVDLVALAGTCGLFGANDSGPALAYTPIAPTGRPIVLWLSEGSNIRNDSLGTPMFTWSENNASSFFLIALTLASYLQTGLHNAPIFFVQPSGAFTSQLIIAAITPQPGLPTIAQDTIGGANPILGSTAACGIIPTIGFVDLRQAAWAGDPLVNNFITAATVIRPNNLSGQPPVLSNQTYNVTNGSELVLCDPDGSGPISVVLPFPELYPLETVLVKRKSAAADAINVTVDGGGNIDGAATFTLPATPFSYQRFRSVRIASGVMRWFSI